MYKIAIALYI